MYFERDFNVLYTRLSREINGRFSILHLRLRAEKRL
jgi:hypothetical protein